MARGKSNKGGRRGGRGRGRGRGGGGGGGGGDRGRKYQDNRQSFEQMKKENEDMERYYNSLNIITDEEERKKFWAALRRELPHSWIFTGSRSNAFRLRQIFVDRILPQIKQAIHKGKLADLPYEIPFVPNGLGYAHTIPKNIIRKEEAFRKFQEFLVSEDGVGNISRQEVVSMIPVLLMDISPEHVILDMCASPGSKTKQIVESLHAKEEELVAEAAKAAQGGSKSLQSIEDQGRPTGLVIANDVNYQRAQMLIHQVKRLNSPNLIVMNHDATMFPSIQLPLGPDKKGEYLKFDRILADVPCSGDGTPRKNLDVWKDWTPKNALGLYITQVRILTRALQLLKVGGRVIYSTCSMNPLEDEAVISSAIERCGGVDVVKLIDCSDRLPALKRSNGLTDWSIMSKNGQIYESWAEARSQEPEDSKVVPGMFPPEAQENIPLTHCMRVYPHQQDTGGFFIAVLQKLGTFKAKPEDGSKCGNKDWCYNPNSEELSNTAVPESRTTTLPQLQNDVQADLINTHGHHVNVLSQVSDPSNAGSDAKQHHETLADAAPPSPKRKAEDAFAVPHEFKKPRIGDRPNEPISTSETTRREDARSTSTSASEAAKVDAGHLNSEFVGNGDTTADNASGVNKIPERLETALEKGVSSSPHLKNAEARRVRRGDGSANVEAFKYLPVDHPELMSIVQFYLLNSMFPRDRFMVRNPAGDPVKGIYYSSQLVKDILTTNAEGKGMKFIHGGIKMFMKQHTQGRDICPWRIQYEGLPIIERMVGEERKIYIYKKNTLKRFLTEQSIPVSHGTHSDGVGRQSLDEISARLVSLEGGGCILYVMQSDGSDDDHEGFSESFVLPLWKGMWSLSLMIPKEDRLELGYRIFGEPLPFATNDQLKPQSQKDLHARDSALEVNANNGNLEDLRHNSKEETAQVAPSTARSTSPQRDPGSLIDD